MGVYNSTYVGVYMEIEHYKKEVTRNVLRNPETNKVVNYKFNEQTGLKSVEDTITENKWISPPEYFDEECIKLLGLTPESINEDEFFSPAYTYNKRSTLYIPNIDGGKSLDELDLYDLSDININVEIIKFRQKYRLLIEALSEFKSITIGYGVITYAH